jgi:hypothetical protein
MLKSWRRRWCEASGLVYWRDLGRRGAMRGDERVQGMMFATVLLEDRVPADHPLRAIRRLGDPILRDLSPQFEALSSQTGRPSIPLSREHCSVDGTLLEAWASQKRVRPNDDDSDRPVDPGNDGGECPRPEAVQCDASLGNGSGRAHGAHVVHPGVGARVSGQRVHRPSAWPRGEHRGQRSEWPRRKGGCAVSVAGDRGRRAARHEGYAISQRARKKIEEVFGWLKGIAGLRTLTHRGTARVDWLVTFACAASSGPGPRPLHAPRTRRGSRPTEAARPYHHPVFVSNQLTNSTTAPTRSSNTDFLSIRLAPLLMPGGDDTPEAFRG